MNSRDDLLNQLIFPQEGGKADPVWLKIFSTPKLIAILANFTPDVLGAVQSEIKTAISEVFQINILSVLVGGWNKYKDVSDALEASRKKPKDTILKQLVDHTVKMENHPYIDLYKDEQPVLGGRIQFKSTAALEVKGLLLKIQNGEITQVLTGTCQGSFQLALEDGGVITQVNTEPFDLPGSVNVKHRTDADATVVQAVKDGDANIVHKAGSEN